MEQGTLYRLAAFANGSTGGNPAGVWLGDQLPEAKEMQSIAKEVGYSETAFIAPKSGVNRVIRYYSPEAEVSFCGHATIATGVILGRVSGEGNYQLETSVGHVPVIVRRRDHHLEASFQSVDTRFEAVTEAALSEFLHLLGWKQHELDARIPPARAYAGAWHLVLAANKLTRLKSLKYDFESMKSLMLDHGLTTLQLVYWHKPDLFHSRNPFPVGGVIEDPATGAAAAALGGYLRDANIVNAPFSFRIRQGEAMGSPSLLAVEVPVEGGIFVTGSANDI